MATDDSDHVRFYNSGLEEEVLWEEKLKIDEYIFNTLKFITQTTNKPDSAISLFNHNSGATWATFRGTAQLRSQ